MLESNPNLRIVSNFAVGYNNIDVEAARELGVTRHQHARRADGSTADLTMALILAVTRRIVEGDAEVRADRPLRMGTADASSARRCRENASASSAWAGSAQRWRTRARAFGMDVIGARRGELARRAARDERHRSTPRTPLAARRIT